MNVLWRKSSIHVLEGSGSVNLAEHLVYADKANINLSHIVIRKKLTVKFPLCLNKSECSIPPKELQSGLKICFWNSPCYFTILFIVWYNFVDYLDINALYFTIKYSITIVVWDKISFIISCDVGFTFLHISVLKQLIIWKDCRSVLLGTFV